MKGFTIEMKIIDITVYQVVAKHVMDLNVVVITVRVEVMVVKMMVVNVTMMII